MSRVAHFLCRFIHKQPCQKHSQVVTQVSYPSSRPKHQKTDSSKLLHCFTFTLLAFYERQMSSSTSVFARSHNRMYDRSIPRLKIQDFFKEVMLQAYRLPNSAIIATLDGNARTKYGDYVFFGVSEVCEEFRQNVPDLFDKVGPIAIAETVKTVFESVKVEMNFKMIKELFLYEAGILTFRLEGRWMAERIKNMLINGMNTWAPIFFDIGARAVFIYPTDIMAGPRMMTADFIRSVCIKDVLANILLYSGVDVCWGDFDDLAQANVRDKFKSTVKRGREEIVSRRWPKTSYFRVECVEGGSNDFYTDLTTLWNGVHRQEADLIVYMTPHRLRGYIQQCHAAATKEGLLDWTGTLTCCGFRTFSGEQQEMLMLRKRWRRYRDSHQRQIFDLY